MDPGHARHLLAAERARLERVREAAGRLSSATDPGGDPGREVAPSEGAHETIEREVDLNVLLQVDREIAEVDGALLRIDAGTYGLCERCGGPISDARLEAMPAARLCLEHQLRARR